MRLRRLTVEGFTQFGALTVDFRDDAPNLILGPNEAGKSHLMAALAAMFFDLPHPELYVPWSGEATMRGCLEMEAGGEIIRLERDFRNKGVVVTEGSGEPWYGKVKGTTTDALRFARARETWLGVGDERLFAATAFVRQTEVIAQERKGVAAQVKTLITGTGETDYDTALRRLQAGLDDLTRLPGKHKDRELEIARGRVSALDQEYAAALTVRNRIAGLETELAGIDERKAAIETERATIRTQLDEADTLIQAEGELEGLEREVRDAEEMVRKLETLERRRSKTTTARDRLTRFGGIDSATLHRLENDVTTAERRLEMLEEHVGRIDIRRLERLEAWVDEARRTLAELPPAPTDEELRVLTDDGSPDRASGVPIPWLLAIGIAGVAVAVGVLWNPAFFALLIVAGGIGFYAARGGGPEPVEAERVARQQGVLRRLGVASPAEARERRERWNAARVQVAETERDLNEELRAASVASSAAAGEVQREHVAAKEAALVATVARDRVLGRLGVDTVAEALAGLDEWNDASQAASVAASNVGVLGDDEAIRAREEAARRALARQEIKVDELLRRDLTLQTLDRERRTAHFRLLRETGEALERELNELGARHEHVERELWRESSGTLREAPVVYQELEAARAEVTSVERRVAALETAIDVLGEAVARFRDNCLGPVETDASEYLRTITDGRYTRVSVATSDLEPVVDTSDRQNIAPGLLSRGVSDQLYFSLRVALARSITGGRTLPLILDDPFVNFDAERLERVIALLKSLVGRTQVIIFTCDDQYVRWLEPTKVLDLKSEQSSSRSGVA